VSAHTNSNPAFTVASVSLNSLRAFEAAGRHLSFTRAGLELSVTQAAISHQVKALEDRLGVALFRRTSRGLVLTDEGVALLPTLSETFDRLSRVLAQFEGGAFKDVLNVGVVGTFAVGWLMPRLASFRAEHPLIDVRLFTNNNKVDIAGDSLDFAIRFGDGAWHGAEADHVLDAPITPLCSPRLAQQLRTPEDLAGQTLLRSYRVQDWPLWFERAGAAPIAARGPMFDSSWLMVEAAMRGDGVALAPALMFERELQEERLVQPFRIEVAAGSYWLTRLKTRSPTPAMQAFRRWLLAVSSS
jgi:LysR family transcriptional regulator of beta-lactamase